MTENRDLDSLFAALLLRVGIIDQLSLDGQFQQWSKKPDSSFGEWLLSTDAISRDEFDSINRLVAAHLKRSGGSIQNSIHSVLADASSSPSPQILNAIFSSLSDSENPASRASAIAGDETEEDPPEAHGKKAEFAWKKVVRSETTSGVSSAKRIDRYEIVNPHARGGLGEVFLANDLELHREVALKKIQTRFADDLSLRKRFVVEAELTGGLEHPGIVPVYGLGRSENGRPYYAMRFIRGKSLSSAIESFHDQHFRKKSSGHWSSQATIEFRKLLQRFVDVCNTIHYAHSRGVLHRDIKPDNIMLGEFGETLVVDWGIAKVIGRKQEENLDAGHTLQPASGSNANETRQGNLIGTPGFMSPAQSMGWHDTLDARDDVYSLGATLFCLVTGERPFHGTSVESVIQMVVLGEIPEARAVNKTVGHPLNAICKKAMATKAADRYASTKSLAQEIEAYLADEAVSAWAEPVSVRLRRWFRKHRTLAIATAATLIVLTAGSLIATVLLASANRRESEARLEAQTNLEQTRSVVDEFFTEVSESQELLKGTPGTQKLRRELLEKARNYYRTFLGENRLSHTDLELAQANVRLANIDRELGDHSSAISFLESAVEQLSQTSMTPETLAQLGEAYLQLAREQNLLGLFSDTISNSKRAIDNFQQVLAGHGQKATDRLANIRFGLASAYIELAGGLSAIDQPSSAATEYESAISILADLAQSETGERQLNYQVALVNTRASLADLQSDSGLTEETLENRIQVVEQLAAIVAASPTDEYCESLGNQHLALADEYLLLRKSDEAKSLAKKSQSLFRELSANNPLVPRYEYSLIRANRWLAKFDDFPLDQEATIAQSFDRSIEISTRSPQNVPFKIQSCAAAGDKAMVLLRSGKRKEAAILLNQAIEIGDQVLPLVTSNYLFEMAEAFDRMGDVYSDFDEHVKAVKLMKESLLLRQRLIDKNPESIRHASAFAQVLNNISLEYASNADVESSIEYSSKALPIAQKIAEEYSEVADYQDDLITSNLSLANAYNYAGSLELAKKHFTDSRSIAQLAREKFGEYGDGLFLQRLSIVDWLEGEFYRQTNENKQAITFLTSAVRSIDELVKNYSSRASHKMSAANVQVSLAKALHADGQFEEAINQSKAAIDIFELELSLKDDLAIRIYLGGAERNIGICLNDMEQFEAAIGYLEASQKNFSRVLDEIPDNEQVLQQQEQLKGNFVETLLAYVHYRLTKSEEPDDWQPLINDASKAFELSGSSDWRCARMLVLIYASMQDEENAEKWIKKAFDLAPEDQLEKLREDFESIRD